MAVPPTRLRGTRDPYEYIKKVENFYHKENKVLGPFNNENRFYKKNTGLFPISLFSIEPFEIFFWEMEHRTGIKMVPAIGLILSLIVGPFAAIVLTETKIGLDDTVYAWIYDLIMRVAIGWHCLVCPIGDILLFMQFPKKEQPLFPFIFWLILYILASGLQIAHLYYINVIVGELRHKNLDISACSSFTQENVNLCKGGTLFLYQMNWLSPMIYLILIVKLFFIWMVIWYARNCRVEELETDRVNLVEPEDWHYYVPNEIYGLGFGYWDNYDTPNPQGELQDYYSDLIAKGLKIEPPNQDESKEMFKYATSTGSCPL